MFKGIFLGLLVAGSILSGQPIPARPEQLTYKPLAFATPRTKDYVATLKNGIKAYLAADPQGVPFVRLKMLIKGGQYLEPKGKEGLASLTGSQWRLGGTMNTPAEQLDERLEFLAGSISSGLGDTSGSLDMQVMAKDLKEGLDLFMQVLLEPAFAQDRLDLAKQEAMQSLQARNDQVPAIVAYQMTYLLNGEGHFTTANMTAASLASITREDIQTFQKRLLHPANLVVAVSGRFEKEAMLALLNRTLGAIQPAKEAQVSPKVPVPELVRVPGLYVVDKDVPQSMIQLAIPGLRRTDPDWHAVVVMNQILGGSGFTSRLMKKLRSDEGLTYGVGTGFGPGAFWKGDFTCSLQTKNRSVAYALNLIFKDIDRIKKEPVTEEEMNVIKDGIAQAFPSDWSKRQVVATRFAQEQLAGWPADWWVNYREKIQAVTKTDVQRVAQKYLDATKAVILVVGKASDAEAGDEKDHPGLLKNMVELPLKRLSLRDPMTLQPLP